ncbi:MAG: hypothetical protein GY799_12875 [Desulfobulbaceae bacterium]|nr:hypothetical protein [Desulfobulbaceae bacterium]
MTESGEDVIQVTLVKIIDDKTINKSRTLITDNARTDSQERHMLTISEYIYNLISLCKIVQERKGEYLSPQFETLDPGRWLHWGMIEVKRVSRWYQTAKAPNT